MTGKNNGKIGTGLVALIALASVAGALLMTRTGFEKKSASINARVTFLVGSAQVTRQKKETVLRAGDALQQGDVIRTGKKSRLVVQVDRVGVLTLFADAVFYLKEVQGGKLKATRVGLDRGRLFSKILKQKKGPYTVQTPTSTAAVRGTSFLTTTDTRGSSHRLLEGKVLVTSLTKKKMTGEEKILEPGSAALVAKNRKVAIRKMDRLEKLETEKLGLYPYREHIDDKEEAERTENNVENEENRLQKMINQELDKLPPLEKLRRQGRPLTMLSLKDGSRITGHVVSSDAGFVRFDTGRRVLSIEVGDIRRRVPVK